MHTDIFQTSDPDTGYALITLTAGPYTMVIAPKANMIITSLTHEGTELLGARKGLPGYINNGSSMGVPLLAPWANRVSNNTYHLAGTSFTVSPEDPLKREEFGRAIHGLLTATRHWGMARTQRHATSVTLTTHYTYDTTHPGFTAFPFPHTITLTYELDGNTGLTVTTSVTAGRLGTPIAFGWHPYLLGTVASSPHHADIPAVPVPLTREEIPAVDGNTAGADPTMTLDTITPGQWDAVIAGPAGHVTVTAITGYPYVLTWTPAGQDWVCVEPMTARTEPWTSPNTVVTPAGETYTAAFRITVTTPVSR